MLHFLFLFSLACWTVPFLGALHWGYLPKNVPDPVMARHRRVARTSAITAVKCVYCVHAHRNHTQHLSRHRWLLPDQGQSAVKFLWLVCSIFAALGVHVCGLVYVYASNFTATSMPAIWVFFLQQNTCTHIICNKRLLSVLTVFWLTQFTVNKVLFQY